MVETFQSLDPGSRVLDGLSDHRSGGHREVDVGRARQPRIGQHGARRPPLLIGVPGVAEPQLDPAGDLDHDPVLVVDARAVDLRLQRARAPRPRTRAAASAAPSARPSRFELTRRRSSAARSGCSTPVSSTVPSAAISAPPSASSQPAGVRLWTSMVSPWGKSVWILSATTDGSSATAASRAERSRCRVLRPIAGLAEVTLDLRGEVRAGDVDPLDGDERRVAEPEHVAGEQRRGDDRADDEPAPRHPPGRKRALPCPQPGPRARRARRDRRLRDRSGGHQLQLPVGGPLDLAEDLHLGLEHDAGQLMDPAAPGRHQGEDVGGRRGAVVLDEVRVLGGEARAADPQAAAAGRIEQLPGRPPLGALVVGVLEGRAERLDPGGLRLAPLRPHLGERRLDRLGFGRA